MRALVLAAAVLLLAGSAGAQTPTPNATCSVPGCARCDTATGTCDACAGAWNFEPAPVNNQVSAAREPPDCRFWQLQFLPHCLLVGAVRSRLRHGTAHLITDPTHAGPTQPHPWPRSANAAPTG